MPALRLIAIIAAVAAGDASLAPAQTRGQVVYHDKCAGCHDGDGSVRAPRSTSLSAMTARAILATLTQGTMREVGAALPEEDRRAVAEYLSRRPVAPAAFPAMPGTLGKVFRMFEMFEMSADDTGGASTESHVHGTGIGATSYTGVARLVPGGSVGIPRRSRASCGVMRRPVAAH